MIARMLTVLVLVVAIGSVSWGMRADAQNQTLEDRVAYLETQIRVMQGTDDELLSRMLPPIAPEQEQNEVHGFFTLEEGYAFELSCNINTYPMGTQYRLQCMRFRPVMD